MENFENPDRYFSDQPLSNHTPLSQIKSGAAIYFKGWSRQIKFNWKLIGLTMNMRVTFDF